MSTTLAADLPRTDRVRASDIARAELTALLDLLASLTLEEWRRPTECAGWDVHAIVAHLAGQSDESNPLIAARHLRTGTKRYPGLTGLDAMNQVQVDEHRDLSPERLTAKLARSRAAAIRSQSKLPGLARRIPVDPKVPGAPKLTLGYLADVILPRDMWTHRLDLCRATGRRFVAGAHDHEIVAQVARDLAVGWGGPTFVLRLTGAVDGTWLIGAGEPVGTVRADALDYVRSLAGREPDPSLVVDGDPALGEAARAARVFF